MEGGARAGRLSRDERKGEGSRMEPLEREIAKALDERPIQQGPARVLIVGPTQDCLEHLVPVLERRKHRCTQVQRLGEARAAVARARYDLILLNPLLPDGGGLDLVATVSKTTPSTKTILVVDDPDPAILLDAVRHGIADVIEDVTDAAILEQIDAAILRARVDRQRDDRLFRLKRICEELNIARREVCEQVDVLCNDLAAAYEDFGSQMDDVAMAAEFRTLVRQELDVEDLLRTSLEYLLTKTGATNAAVFLADHDHSFGLGAYVNYDCPRDAITVLLDRLCQAVCPQMIDEEQIVSFADTEEFGDWIGIETAFMAESQVIAYSCRHGGECLAVVVLFRSKDEPFEDGLGATIDVLRPLFAEQLSNVITIHHRATSWPKDADDDAGFNDEFGFGFGGELAA